MDAEAVKRTTGYALLGATVLAYFSRPWSCWFVLSRFSPEDPVPYSHFDYHGYIFTFACLIALLFAAPILWLASKLFLSGDIEFRLFAWARDFRATIVSVLIALGIGAPMLPQVLYLFGLPIGITAPIWLSSLAWLLVVELGRTAAVSGNRLSKGGVYVAAVLAVTVSVAKLALFRL
ncbi:MAG: hypothetical protein PHE36_01740 [Novosphingobium sp.]|nr:hypothetical protein [Novosphingobium sp.]